MGPFSGAMLFQDRLIKGYVFQGQILRWDQLFLFSEILWLGFSGVWSWGYLGQVYQCSGFQVSVFSGVRFFRCPIFQGPHFSTVKFSRGQVFQESGLQGSDLYVVSFRGVRYG